MEKYNWGKHTKYTLLYIRVIDIHFCFCQLLVSFIELRYLVMILLFMPSIV